MLGIQSNGPRFGARASRAPAARVPPARAIESCGTRTRSIASAIGGSTRWGQVRRTPLEAPAAFVLPRTRSRSGRDNQARSSADLPGPRQPARLGGPDRAPWPRPGPGAPTSRSVEVRAQRRCGPVVANAVICAPWSPMNRCSSLPVQFQQRAIHAGNHVLAGIADEVLALHGEPHRSCKGVRPAE